MRVTDPWGTYVIADNNVTMSYSEVLEQRERHKARNELDKRHQGVDRTTIERTMRLTHL